MASRDALTHTEALRIKFLVDDAIEKLAFLAEIPNQSAGGELSKAVAEEIARSIESQKQRKEMYSELMRLRASQQGLTQKDQLQKTQDQIEVISRKLAESSKTLCSHLDNAPNEEKNIKKVQEERGTLANWFAELSYELAHSMSFNSIAQHAEDRRRESELLTELRKKLFDRTNEVRSAEKALRDTQMDFEKAAAIDDAAIHAHKEQLRGLRAEASMQIALETKKLLAHEQTLAAVLVQEEKALEQRLVELKEENSKLKHQAALVRTSLSKQTRELEGTLKSEPLRSFDSSK